MIKNDTPNGNVEHCIDEDICKGCGICVDVCPAGIIRLSSRRNRKGYRVPEILEPDRCRQCHMCENCCPDLAVFVCSAPAGGQGAKD